MATKLQAEVLDRWMGKVIGVTFTDGRQLSGLLVAHDTYTLVLRVKRNAASVDVLIYKHAVKYIHGGA